MTDDTSGPVVEPERRVAGLVVRLEAHRRVVEQRADLGSADMRLLWLLSDGRPRTLRRIADDLGLEQSTVNRQVNTALREGVVSRDRPDLGAAYLVSATDGGLARFERELSSFLGLYVDALDALGPRRDEFLDLLATFVDAYGSAVRRSGD